MGKIQKWAAVKEANRRYFSIAIYNIRMILNRSMCVKLDESDTTERKVFQKNFENHAGEEKRRKKKETVADARLWYLLLIFIPPRGGFAGCLLPSAKEVVLGRPLILKLSRPPPPPPPHLHRDLKRLRPRCLFLSCYSYCVY